jgi:hypothetical protein
LTDETCGDGPNDPIDQPRGKWRLRFVGYIECKMHERRAKRKKETPVENSARVTTRATVWMAIFTAILAGVGIATYCVLKNQLGEMRKTGIDAETTKRLDERAWMGVVGFGPAPEIGKSWSLVGTFSNTGKTPAKKVHLACTVEPASDEASIKWTAPTVQKPSLTSPNGQTLCIMHPISQTNVEEPKLVQKNLDDLAQTTLFVYGSVVYQDIFGMWHWLTFCSSMAKDGHSFDACKEGNDTGDGDMPPPPFNKIPKPD